MDGSNLLGVFLDGLLRNDIDFAGLVGNGCASGVVYGTNPPYAIGDFLGIYPKFGTIDDEGNYDGPIPQIVLQMYINLASASMMQARWLDMWPMAMAEFIAHYCTLYLRSAGDPNSTPGKIAASGLQKGITVSKSAGGVSSTMQFADWMNEWGDFAKTDHGSRLITWAKSIGSGPILVL
jgi:hypothetical protein